MHTLLLADDDRAIRSLLQRLLTRAQRCMIHEAGDGAEALRLAQQERPSVAVLDGEMPHLTGYEVCRVLKADRATRGIRVLLFTGSLDPDAEAQARAAGADGFFRKGAEIGPLVMHVQALLSL